MSEIDNNNNIVAQITRRKQIREPPSVPFLWESKPGVPIKNWKPEIKNLPILHQPPFPFLLIDHDEINSSESEFSNWDSESMVSYMTCGTDETESNRSVFVMKKSVPTLGELIMMSRKMSIRRKRAEIRKLSTMQKRGVTVSSCFNVSTRVGLNLLTGN